MLVVALGENWVACGGHQRAQSREGMWPFEHLTRTNDIDIYIYLAHLGKDLSSPDSKKQWIKHLEYNSLPGRDLPTVVFDGCFLLL